ncbi:MAG TPA: hypothetical protein VG871_12725 [Vicinamibacterales bacterium]|nr:hypothetical protein [Vicinamibacterales bacterium]
MQTTVSATGFRPQASSTATGTVRLAGGATTTVSGTYESTTQAVNLSGGGLTLAGSVAGSVLSGTYTGDGATAGGFSALNAASSTVTTYCGKYGPSFYDGPPANPPGGEVGVFNVVVSSTGAASGTGVSTNVSGDPGFLLTGQLSGSTLTLTSFDLLSHKQKDPYTLTLSNSGISASCGGTCTITGSTSACQ